MRADAEKALLYMNGVSFHQCECRKIFYYMTITYFEYDVFNYLVAGSN